MKIAYCSDLHIDEWYSLYLLYGVADIATLFNTEKAEVLCISGDIAEFEYYKKLDYFFRFVSKQFKMVFIIPGNHEYYKDDINKDLSEIAKLLPKNVVMLNNTSHKYKDITFYGGTYWPDLTNTNSTELHAIQSLISDFRYIKNINVDILKSKYDQFIDGMWETIYNDDNIKDIVVLSHFPPTELSVSDKFKGNILNDYFCNKNDNIPSEVRYWICGHVHHKHEYSIGNTRVLCNPRGYPKEHNNFNLKYVDI